MKLLLSIITVGLYWFGCESKIDVCTSGLWKTTELYDVFKDVCKAEEKESLLRKIDADPYEIGKSLYLRRPKNFDSRTRSDKNSKPPTDGKVDQEQEKQQQCQSDCNDEDGIQVKSWSFDYKKLSPDQKMYTKKAIQDILFEGQVGTLSRKSVLINVRKRCASNGAAHCKQICRAKDSQPTSSSSTTPAQSQSLPTTSPATTTAAAATATTPSTTTTTTTTTTTQSPEVEPMETTTPEEGTTVPEETTETVITTALPDESLSQTPDEEQPQPDV